MLRPDRALFIRRLIATYHQRKTSKPVLRPVRVVPRPRPQAVSTELTATVRQVLRGQRILQFRKATLAQPRSMRFHVRRVLEFVGNPEIGTALGALQPQNRFLCKLTRKERNWRGTALGELYDPRLTQPVQR
jgi:hypothetical protein